MTAADPIRQALQRAYESHCADGYVVPDDETGPQEATGATESDETRVQAHGDGEAAERRTASQSVIERAAEIVMDWMVSSDPVDGAAGGCAQALAAAGLLADPEREVAWLRKVERRTDERDHARDALDETLDDLTRTLARAEKAEDWQREVCDMLGYEPDGADEVLTYLPAWRAEASAKDEEIARLRQPSGVWRCSNSHAERAEKAEAERDRARDTAAALEAENSRLSAKVERVRQARDEWDSGHLPIHWRGFVADIDRALSGTTGEATR